MAIVDPRDIMPRGTVGYLDFEAMERARNTISFQAGNPTVEMLKVSQDGFWVRGVKVPQDDKEAETVYNAFKQFLVWAELNRR